MPTQAPPETPLETEVKFLLKNHETLRKKHPGRYLVIQGERVIHADRDEDAAVDVGMKNLKGDFLVRHVDQPDDRFSITGLVVEIPPGSCSPGTGSG